MRGRKSGGSGMTRGAAALAALLLCAGAPGFAAQADAAADAPAAGEPAPFSPLPIALYPIENLSGGEAPLGELRDGLRARLEERLVPLVDDAALARFMRRDRVRYVGGLGTETGRKIRDDLGAGAVLVTSLDLYQEANPPKVALTARLVAAGDAVRILWMESYDATGDEAPGFLGLGRVLEAGPIEATVLDRLAASLAARLQRAAGTDAAGNDVARAAAKPAARRFLPRTFFRSARAAIGRKPIRAAVVPFENQSTTRHAADIVSLQIVRRLGEAGGIDVIEPGVVREALLRSRIIQEEGLSAPQAELIRIVLGADIVFFGEVNQYVEAWAGAAEPQVDFLVRVMDTRSQQVIVAADSRCRGDDGVVFFGMGRVPTAHRLASRMVQALAERTASALEGEP